MAAIVKANVSLVALLRSTLARSSPLLATLLGAAAGTPTLAPLSLSNNNINENSAAGTVVGSIQNLTAGSALSLSVNAGGRFSISGTALVAGATSTDYEAATSHSVTIVETLAGATGTPKSTTLTIGVVNLNDTNPSAFTFTDVSSAALSTLETSNAITVAGLGASDSATASISGAASSQMSVNGGSWGAGPATVVNGDTIAVRHTSSGANSASVNTTLTVGTTSDTYTSTTVAGGGAVTFGVTYDSAIGNGVDAAGFADLPLRAGAKRFFVNSSTGSDSNNSTQAQTAATAVATVTKALTYVTGGAGDQILVAQGTSYSAVFPEMSTKGGFSPVYPTVIQSYDHASPTDTTKYGRATGSNRPVFTNSGNINLTTASGDSPDYIVVRGLDFNPGNIPDVYLGITPNVTDTVNYVLFENNIFRYIMLSVDQALAKPKVATGIIIRGNSFYGQWSATDTAQGLYMSTIGYTLEDNIFWRNGWKVGANRGDSMATGGLVGGAPDQRHPIYAQYSANGIGRRNWVIDGAADGGSFRGDNIWTSNIGTDNPIIVGMGGGSHYYVERTDGVLFEVSYNAFLGDADISPSDIRGWGIHTANGRAGTAAHHNIVAHARNPTTAYEALQMSCDEPNPSYTDWYANAVYQWNNGINHTNRIETTGFSSPDIIHSSYNTNAWDEAASGTNINNAGVFPTPMTNDDVFVSMGYTGANAAARRQAFIDDAIAFPEKHHVQLARNAIMAGYARAPVLQDLVTSVQLTRGQVSSLPLLGTVDGSVLTSSGLPAGLTVSSDRRFWTYDGTGSGATSGTFTVTETPATGSPRTTTLPYTISVPATLSAGSAVSTGSTTGTATVDTDTGSGTLYWVAATYSTSTINANQIENGFWSTYDDPVALSDGAKGSQAVSATGTQSISLTGLQAGHAYYIYTMQKVGFTRSAVRFAGTFTASATGGVWNAATSSTDWVESNTNHTATRPSGSGDALVRGQTFATSGYFEVTVNAVGTGNLLIGLTDSSAVTADYVHNHGASYRSDLGFVSYENGFQFTGSSYTAGDVIGVALKAGKAYFSKNGVWQNGSNPSAGTGGIDVSSTMGSGANQAMSTAGTDAQGTLNGTGSFVYAIPTGLAAWG